ncbi:MAG: uroporphyrinogen-III C-methyltransferase [Planctomycetota bacterium]
MPPASPLPRSAARVAHGRVLFVGAGPGDPELLTVRAVDCLRRADVVVYDTLVPQEVLDLVDPAVERLSVPRESREASGDPGEATGRLLAQLALDGRLVVRLKGGDPAVFGRLSEEIGPVREAGIPVEIVPGITAVVAAAAAAGIPLTSRSAASSLTIVTGHEAGDKRESIDFRPLAALPGTLAIYMGVEQVDRWSTELLSAGKPSDTPVTIVSHCSWPDQRIAVSTLSRCVADFQRHNWPSPAVVIIGEVAQPVDHPPMAPTRGPLSGRRVLSTRPPGQGDNLDTLVRGAGGSCLHVPVISLGPPPSWQPLDEAIRQADTYDWIVFASTNGVRSFVGRLRAAGLDGRALGTVRLAAIGPATRLELDRAGFACDLTPDLFRSEGIIKALVQSPRPSRFLLVRANRGRDLMRRELAAKGHEVHEVVAYSSEPIAAIPAATATTIDQQPIDWLTVTSGLIAESAVQLFGERIRQWRIASLSPITSAALSRHGIIPTVEAKTASAECLIAAMIAWEIAHAARPA